MKIGVITITEGANYGNKLQNYAVTETFRKLGYDAENVKKNCDANYSLKVEIKRLIMKIAKIKSYKYFSRKDAFRIFSKKYLKNSKKYYTDNDFDTNDYHMFFCGSDQVWNVEFPMICDEIDYYFAGFAPESKRAAFSASIGVDEIPNEYKEQFVDYINKMPHISVREAQAAKIIKDLTGRGVPVTIDPTLMLSKDEWLKIAKKPKRIGKNQKYVLTYFLANYTPEVKNYVDTIAQKYGYSVVNLQDYLIDKNDINDTFFAMSPKEFIWLVANCEAFITDSFHGCVFSTIFKKPFRWFSRSGGFSKNMNSRLETLFDKLQLGDWCIGDVNEPVENIFNCDYSSVDENLAKEQEFAYDYLKGALK